MALNINGTTGISGVDGSASAPALTGTDANTGINFGSDVIDLSTGGSSRFKVGAAGQLGVAGANYGTSGQALLSQGASAAPQWGTVSAGITEADIWRLTQDVQASQGALSTLTAWERADDAESTFIGTGMTYNSSGEYFHFPSTGKWLINVSLVLYGQYAFGWGFIATQFRGSGSSSYDGVAAAWANVSANGGYGGGFSQCLVDVTETGSSGARVYFDQQAVSTAGRFIHGSTTQNRTSLAFIRLGDT
jgi:hypothetical protein